MTEAERAAVEARQELGGGPRRLGPWLVWKALDGAPGDGTTGAPGHYPAGALERVVPPPAWILPRQAGQYPLDGDGGAAAAGTYPSSGTRLILDLCAGSGSWSEPYERAGYRVIRVTLPDGDIRTFVPPPDVWGILCAPPCPEFSLAKNGRPRDFVAGMECVNACMRVVLQARPRWWSLENPVGYLGQFLGTPRDVFEPCDFGDAWTKRTALWGDFALPRRGPFVEPTGSAMDRPNAAARAVTPPGFARAFFEANP